MEETISAETAKALQIVRDHDITMPRQFARFMWPDSEAWKHHTKAGPNGVAKGGGMPLAAGGYLGKLQRRGLVRIWYGFGGNRSFKITDAGIAALEKWTKENGDQTDNPS
jgi:hypothetical protein